MAVKMKKSDRFVDGRKLNIENEPAALSLSYQIVTNMETQVPQKLTKKAARQQVEQAFASLTDLKHTLGTKKFRRRIAKVERILLEGLPKEKKKTVKTEADNQQVPLEVVS
jgi:hypothetical protein